MELDNVLFEGTVKLNAKIINIDKEKKSNNIISNINSHFINNT